VGLSVAGDLDGDPATRTEGATEDALTGRDTGNPLGSVETGSGVVVGSYVGHDREGSMEG
jgi:hypothetical protein